MLDHRALFEAAVTLFDLDGRGRLQGGAPHLHVLRTPDDVICFCRGDVPGEVAATLQAIALRPRQRPGEWSREYADYLNALSPLGAPKAVRAGPIYSFPDVIAENGATISVSERNSELLRGGLEEWLPDVATSQPMRAVVIDGRATAVCASVARSHAAHSAGVEVLPRYRRQGLATQVVAAWARSVRALRLEPFYATTFDNVASQNVARRLGLTPFGTEYSVELETA
jgi:hypothetical protein